MNGVVVSVRDLHKPSKLGVWVNSDGTYNRMQILSHVLEALALVLDKKWVVSIFSKCSYRESQ